MTELTDMINQFDNCKHCINFCYNDFVDVENGFKVYCGIYDEFKTNCEDLEVE